MNEIRNMRRRLIRQIKRLVAPHLYASGYVSGSLLDDEPSTPVMLVAFKQDLEVKIPNCMSDLDDGSFLGFTEYGLIEDCAGGGMVEMYYRSIAVEDLVKLVKIAERLPSLKRS